MQKKSRYLAGEVKSRGMFLKQASRRNNTTFYVNRVQVVIALVTSTNIVPPFLVPKIKSEFGRDEDERSGVRMSVARTGWKQVVYKK